MLLFSVELPHRGDSNENTQHTIIVIKQNTTRNYPKYSDVCNYGMFFKGSPERVRNSRGKRAISVQATDVLL